MQNLSQPYRYPEIESARQQQQTKETLRTELWNALSLLMWNFWEPSAGNNGYSDDSTRINAIINRLWCSHLKLDIETLPNFKQDHDKRDAYDILKDYFFGCTWTKVYAFIDFLVQDRDTYLDGEAIRWLNKIFEEENSAYRIICNKTSGVSAAKEAEMFERQNG